MKYDAKTCEAIEEKDNRKKINISIIFSPDGNYIATASCDTAVSVYANKNYQLQICV